MFLYTNLWQYLNLQKTIYVLRIFNVETSIKILYRGKNFKVFDVCIITRDYYMQSD